MARNEYKESVLFNIININNIKYMFYIFIRYYYNLILYNIIFLFHMILYIIFSYDITLEKELMLHELDNCNQW